MSFICLKFVLGNFSSLEMAAVYGISMFLFSRKTDVILYY